MIVRPISLLGLLVFLEFGDQAADSSEVMSGNDKIKNNRIKLKTHKKGTYFVWTIDIYGLDVTHNTTQIPKVNSESGPKEN